MAIFGKLNFLNSHLWILYIKADSKLTLPSQKTCSKLTIETQQQGVKYVHVKRRSGVFIVNFEHISHLVLMFLFVTMSS